MSSTRAFFSSALTIAGLVLILFAAGARAEVFTVNKTADTNDGVCDIDCSLREAIAVAATGDVVQFATPPFNSPQTITLTLGELTITRSITVLGSGANLLTVRVGSDNPSRAFLISGGGVSVKISGMTITGGRLAGNSDGAGISNSGSTLYLTNVHITDNVAIKRNGGGVYNGEGGTVHVLDSTISSNTAHSGGGIANTNGNVTLTNTTLSLNIAASGGGFFNNSGLTLTNVTIVTNTGGVQNNGVVFVRNTIIVGAVTGAFNSQGNNLISNPGSSTGWIASDLLNVNPQLSPLANNGGQTPTHALMAGSPAINGGNNALAINPASNLPLQLDQRLYNRIAGGTVDIGAFEADSSPAGAVTIRGQVTITGSSRGVHGALAVLRFADTGEIRHAVTNPFGYYYFNNIPMGSTVIITLTHKRYKIPPQVFTATGEVNYLGSDPNRKSEAVSASFWIEDMVEN